MTRRYHEITYQDELLSDGTVRRAYSDGRQEWRRRERASVVSWRDDRGRTGVDELLGGRVIKRRIEPDTVVYGRDAGYGRTTWSDGTLTVNRTSVGGRAGLIIAGIGAAGLLPALTAPPSALTPEEEEQLRRQAQQASSGDGSADTGTASDADWSGPGYGADDDFG